MGCYLNSLEIASARVPAPPLALDVHQRYQIPECCQILKCSRSHFYKEIAPRIRNKLIREGDAMFVPGSELAKLAQPPKPDEATTLPRCRTKSIHRAGPKNFSVEALTRLRPIDWRNPDV
jgi:hypothetical protein